MTWLLSGVQWGTYATRTRYAYLQGTVSRSGNTVTLSNLSLYFTLGAYQGTGSATETVSIVDATGGGTTLSSKSVTWSFTSPSSTSNTVYLNDASVSVSASATTRSFALTAPGGDYAEFTVNFEAGATAPSSGFIDTILSGTDWIELTGGVHSMGTGGSQNYIRLCIAQQSPLSSSVAYDYEDSTYPDDTLRITNNSSKENGGVTISTNSAYNIGVYANNGVLDYWYTKDTVVTTLVNKATIALVGTPTTSGATFSYTIEADGGYQNKQLQQSVDGGVAYSPVASITGGNAVSGTFFIASLMPGTVYTLKTRIQLGNKYIQNDDVIFSIPDDSKFYGSVAGKTKSVKKLYGSVNGKTKLTKKLYGSVNGKTKRIL